MDLFESVRNKAMLDVMEGSFLYHYRRLCRWYSMKFNTPLPQVMELPEEEVLQTFFETQFEDMSKAARRKLALEMTETDEEAKERQKKEAESSDDAFLKRQEKQAAKEAKAQLKKLQKEAKEAAEKLAAMADKEMVAAPKKAKPKKEAAKPPPPPDISMSFDDNGNLLGDEECIPLPPPRKR